jgi:uncharacterized protein YjbJ (UPF0337 family)
MNHDQVRGLWGQLKGRAKVAWGELTADPDRKAEGTIDKLFGLVQRRFGDSKQELKRRIDKIRLS